MLNLSFYLQVLSCTVAVSTAFITTTNPVEPSQLSAGFPEGTRSRCFPVNSKPASYAPLRQSPTIIANYHLRCCREKSMSCFCDHSLWLDCCLEHAVIVGVYQAPVSTDGVLITLLSLQSISGYSANLLSLESDGLVRRVT